jgi:hypothetical protein
MEKEAKRRRDETAKRLEKEYDRKPDLVAAKVMSLAVQGLQGTLNSPPDGLLCSRVTGFVRWTMV